MKYTVDLRYVSNGLLKSVLGTFSNIDDAEKSLKQFEKSFYFYKDTFYLEIGIVR